MPQGEHWGLWACRAGMRRCVLALFVLQLLWNMAGFCVLGWLHERPPTTSTSVAVSVVDAQLNEGKGLADQAHGLMDELPDLPDTLLRRPVPKVTAGPAPAHSARVPQGLPSPLPESLFRPPRAG